MVEGRFQLAHQGAQSVYHLLIVHTLGTDNSYGSPQSVAQYIIGCHDAAVPHRLNQSLISDINLYACILLAVSLICKQIFKKLFLLQSSQKLTGLLSVAQLRVLENIRGSSGINLKILLICPDSLCNLIEHQIHDLPSASRLFIFVMTPRLI